MDTISGEEGSQGVWMEKKFNLKSLTVRKSALSSVIGTYKEVIINHDNVTMLVFSMCTIQNET